MRRDDYILMSSLALLNAFPESRSRIVQALLNDEVFELDQLGTPSKFSIGFRIGAESISMNGALQRFDSEIILAVQVVLAEKDSRPLLQIKTDSGVKGFELEVTFSSPFAITPNELIELLNAQSFPQEIWQSVLEFINAGHRLNKRLEIDAAELRRYLTYRENQNHFNMIVESIIEILQIEALVRGADFVIPIPLSSRLQLRKPDLSYGTPLNEANKDPRYLASLQLNKQDSWALAPAVVRWEMYLWNEISGNPWQADVCSFGIARAGLKSALERCNLFSERLGTAFTEAFQLALFVLNDPLFKSMSLNSSFVSAAEAAVAKNNFSERAKAVFARVFKDTQELLAAGLTPEVVCSLKAFNIANVFGGTGSWGDQSFPKADDNVEYKNCSSQLYQALQLFFVATLNKIC